MYTSHNSVYQSMNYLGLSKTQFVSHVPWGSNISGSTPSVLFRTTTTIGDTKPKKWVESIGTPTSPLLLLRRLAPIRVSFKHLSTVRAFLQKLTRSRYHPTVSSMQSTRSAFISTQPKWAQIQIAMMPFGHEGPWTVEPGFSKRSYYQPVS